MGGGGAAQRASGQISLIAAMVRHFPPFAQAAQTHVHCHHVCQLEAMCREPLEVGFQ